MPTWEELFGDASPSDPTELPSDNVVAQALERARQRPDAFVVAIPMAEPAVAVGRVTLHDADGDRASALSVAQCINGGWWFVDDNEHDLPPTGWQWNVERFPSRTRAWRDATTQQDRDRLGPRITYRFDGPEPPPGIIRLRQLPYAPVSDDDEGRTVTRCARIGWHWVHVTGWPCCEMGWPWGIGSPNDDLVPEYPVLHQDNRAHTALKDRMAAELLPADNQWYWIAIDGDTNHRIWACRDDDGDTWFHTGDKHPEA